MDNGAWNTNKWLISNSNKWLRLLPMLLHFGFIGCPSLVLGVLGLCLWRKEVSPMLLSIMCFIQVILGSLAIYFEKRWLFKMYGILNYWIYQWCLCWWIYVIQYSAGQCVIVFLYTLAIVAYIAYPERVFIQFMNKKFDDENTTMIYGLATSFLFWPFTLIYACYIQCGNKKVQRSKKKRIALMVLNVSIIIGIISYWMIRVSAMNQPNGNVQEEVTLHPFVRAAYDRLN